MILKICVSAYLLLYIQCVTANKQTSLSTLKDDGSHYLHQRSAVCPANKDESQLRHIRQKRGWGSIIFYGTSLLIRGTSFGLNLAAILKEGCVYFPSICSNRDAMRRMDSEIKTLKKQFDRDYLKNAREWTMLKTASTKNGYVNYYIDEAVSTIQTLAELQEKMLEEMESRIPAEIAKWHASQNFTSEQYLEFLEYRIDYNIADIEKMIEKNKNLQLIILAARYMVEAIFSKFVSFYGRAFKTVRALQTGNINFKGRVKLVPKVLMQMLRNSRNYVRKFTSWRGIKGELMKKIIDGPKAKLRKVNKFFKSSTTRRNMIKSFKLGWSTRIMTVIGTLTDAVGIAASAVEWKKVANKMSMARKNYEEFLSNLRQEIENLKVEQASIAKEWKNVADAFKELSQLFEGFVKDASQNANFTEVEGLLKLPISQYHSMFNINFQTMDKVSLPTAQDSVISFLKENDNNLTEFADKMRARLAFYADIKKRTNKNEKVNNIFSNLKDVFELSPSATVRDFGRKLSKKDVVCSIAIMFLGVSEYDYYLLQSFRPLCSVTDWKFKTMEAEARRKRNMGVMNSIVQRQLEKDRNQTSTNLLNIVQNIYVMFNDENLVAFGLNLTEQDIFCSIATQFPKMRKFDMIDLSVFRPDCKAVSSTTFASMKQSAHRMSSLNAHVGSSMELCISWKFCPCISDMTVRFNATENEIKATIKRLKPNMQEYCATMGCACVDL